MSQVNHAPRTIDGRARTIRELMDGARFSIDFYQREYAWQERQVDELINDLSSAFLRHFDPSHARERVEHYGHYFLGSIIVSHKEGRKFIVDGQQRLTTLTLLLIHIHRLQQGREDAESVESLIYSKKYGKPSFNLDVPERTPCLERLLDGEPFDPSGHGTSVQNIAARYEDIVELFPEDLKGSTLPYFIDWLKENVHLVEIETYSDDDAYTIFETMNDRGLSLSMPDMLKSFLLANIYGDEGKHRVSELWRRRLKDFQELGKEEDVDFFKNWLRARYAESASTHKKESTALDYEQIGSQFHRWVRSSRDLLRLNGSPAFLRFINQDFDFYSKQALRIRRAAKQLTEGLESIRFNEDRQFTSQTQLLLAALRPTDSAAAIQTKLRLIADYLDIWLTRRAWAFRDNSQSTVRYQVFNLSKRLRELDVEGVSHELKSQLEGDDSPTFAKNPNFHLHGTNSRQVRHVLARLTYWLDQQCGVPTHYEDLISKGSGLPFEIEHLWPNHPERFRDDFAHASDFERARNRLGGLVLLQRGTNQSLGDAPYEQKRDAYGTQGQSLLTRSLHPLTYQNNPNFTNFLNTSGLQFMPYEHFGVQEQNQRQELYLRLAEWVWNPSRLDLDGIKPPTPEPLQEDDEEILDEPGSNARAKRREQRFQFWARVIAASKREDGMYAGLNPSPYNWIATHRAGFQWTLVCTRDEVRGELYLSSPHAEQNKSVFDLLFQQKVTLENAFGEPLEWERLDSKRGARISFRVAGGWADPTTWDNLVPALLLRQERLFRILAEPAARAKEQGLG